MCRTAGPTSASGGRGRSGVRTASGRGGGHSIGRRTGRSAGLPRGPPGARCAESQSRIAPAVRSTARTVRSCANRSRSASTCGGAGGPIRRSANARGASWPCRKHMDALHVEQGGRWRDLPVSRCRWTLGTRGAVNRIRPKAEGGRWEKGNCQVVPPPLRPQQGRTVGRIDGGPDRAVGGVEGAREWRMSGLCPYSARATGQL